MRTVRQLAVVIVLTLLPLNAARAATLYKIQAIVKLGDKVGNPPIHTATKGDAAEHAVLWTNGKIQDLGTLGGANSNALAINAAGQVVGYSTTIAEVVPGAGSAVNHAFLWDSGGMKDLNSLLPTGSGWFLFTALGINDPGQVVGNGVFNGQERAYLLTPTQ